MTEDKIFLESLFCIEDACKHLGLKYEYFGTGNNTLAVQIPGFGELCFFKNKNPFNSSIALTLCNDKVLNWSFFERYQIPMPDSVPVVNPNYNQETFEYSLFKTPKELFDHAMQKWGTPFILKKAISSLSKNVHLVSTQADAELYWNEYFSNPNERNNLIIQEFVAGREFRVVAFKGKTLLAYEKISEESLEERANHNDLNPLHSGRPLKITDSETLAKFQPIVEDVYTKVGLNFTGLDIIIDPNGKSVVLEANANPACFFYNSFYGREDFIKVYQECLKEYLR